MPQQPNILRARISQDMAFPIGFEFLREQFGDISQWSDAAIYFTAHPTTFASEFARILHAHEPYRILRVARRPETRVPSHRPAHWSFHIYPVERSLKSVARAGLNSGALPTLRDFVSRAPTHANYYNHCDALFDPNAGTCATQLLWEV